VEATVIGWGGIEKVNPEIIESGKVRKPGGGRKKLIESLIEPTTRGDPESPLRWTCKSTRKLARELKIMGHNISHARVAGLLRMQGYSLQSNQKVIEGNNHPDRNAQFIFINKITISTNTF